jgi:hypothetical protein
MKGKEYKAYGCDEYANYISEDNGRHWKVINLDAKECMGAIDSIGRIIYGSLNDGGLTYSDDGGITIEFSDHPTGSWDNIVWTSDKVFAHSLDDGRIVYTLDWGEHWVDLIDGSGDGKDNSGTNLSIDGNGNLVISDSDGTKLVDTSRVGLGDGSNDSNALIGIYPDSYFDGNGELTSNGGNAYDFDEYDSETDESGNKRFKVSGLLLILINKYLLPQIVYNLTGYTDPSVLDFNDGFTWGNVSYSNFFTDGQVYNISKDRSVLNLEKDVGMMPFNITANLFSDKGELNDISLTEEIKDVGDGRLKTTLDLIDKVLDIKRDYARQQISNIISDTAVDTSEIEKLNTSDEDYANAVSMLQMYINVQKGSMISIIGTMIGYIFSFDTQKKISLLKAAIYETITRKVGALNYQLKQAASKIDENGMIDASEIDLSYNFSEGLNEAIKKYLETCMESVKYLTQTGQKDLISTAAEQYKSEYRPAVLEDLAPKFYNSKNDNKNNSALDFLKQKEEEWRTNNSAARGNLNDLQIEERIQTLDINISEEQIKIYINNIYTSLLNNMQELLGNYKVEDYWFDDYELDDYTNAEFLALEHYYKQITGDEYLNNGSGFKGRCVELLKQVKDSYVENQGGYNFFIEYLQEEIKERNRQWLANENYSKSIEDVLDGFQSRTFKILKEGWYKNRRLI